MCRQSEVIFNIVDEYLDKNYEPDTHASLVDSLDITLAATEFIKDNARIIKNRGFQLYIYWCPYNNYEEKSKIKKPRIGEYKKLLPFLWRLLKKIDSTDERGKKDRTEFDNCWSWLLEFINLYHCENSSYYKPEKFTINNPISDSLETTETKGFVVYIANGEVY